MFCNVKLSIFATRMQFCCCQAGDGIRGRLNVSNDSSQNVRHHHTCILIHHHILGVILQVA